MKKIKIIYAVFVALFALTSCDDSGKSNNSNLLLLVASSQPSSGSIAFGTSGAVNQSQQTWQAEMPFTYDSLPGFYLTRFLQDSNNNIILGVKPTAVINTDYNENSALWNITFFRNGNRYDKAITHNVILNLTQKGNGKISGTIAGELYCNTCAEPISKLNVNGSFSCSME